jgi:hypothetical protein
MEVWPENNKMAQGCWSFLFKIVGSNVIDGKITLLQGQGLLDQNGWAEYHAGLNVLFQVSGLLQFSIQYNWVKRQ